MASIDKNIHMPYLNKYIYIFVSLACHTRVKVNSLFVYKIGIRTPFHV